MSSVELKAIGEKTHISLKSATLCCVAAVIPMTYFLAKMSFDIDELKVMHRSDQVRMDELVKRVDDMEKRLWLLEPKKTP